MSREHSLSVRVVLSPAEQRAASRLLQRFLPAAVVRHLRVVNTVCWLLQCVLLYIVINRFEFLRDEAFYGDEIAFHALLWMLGAMFCSAVLFNVLFVYEMRLRRQAIFRPNTQRQFVYTVTPEGFYSEENGRYCSLYLWPSIERVVHEGSLSLVFIDQAAAFVLPTRVFPHALAAARFFQLLEHYREKV